VASNKQSLQDSEAKMAIINEAYYILKDADRKKQYDYYLKYGSSGTANCNEDEHAIHKGGSNRQYYHPRTHYYHSFDQNFGEEGAKRQKYEHGEEEEKELNFQIKPGLNPFSYVPAPLRGRYNTANQNSSGEHFFSPTFAFSSMTSSSSYIMTGDGDGGREGGGNSKTTYIRKTTQYYNGWKDTCVETATVDVYGNTVYKRSIKREKSQLQNFKDIVSSWLMLVRNSSTINNVYSSSSSPGQTAAHNGSTTTNNNNNNNNNNNKKSSKDERNSNDGYRCNRMDGNSSYFDWIQGFMNQMRKCTGPCGAFLVS